jgi:hypothetical protein
VRALYRDYKIRPFRLLVRPLLSPYKGVPATIVLDGEDKIVRSARLADGAAKRGTVDNGAATLGAHLEQLVFHAGPDTAQIVALADLATKAGAAKAGDAIRSISSSP